MKLLYTIIGMLVVVFVITFSLRNTELVHLQYYDFIDINVPSYLLIFISFGVGVLFTGFLDIIQRIGLKRTTSKLKRRIKELEREVATTGHDTTSMDAVPGEEDEVEKSI
jgi:uncharacterized integral membrane protein